MNGAFYIGATGLNSQQRALEVVAGNVANMNTPAFKRAKVSFSQLVATGGALDPQVGPQPQSLAGVAVDSGERVFTQGDIKSTGGPMDLAIQGEGFIELLGPGGETLLWRGGTLNVGEDGFLAAQNGLPLKAMVSVPYEAGELTIDRAGEVRIQSGDRAETIGRIELVRANDVSGLEQVADGLYRPKDDAQLIGVGAGEDGAGVLVQGALEASNVELSEEMVLLLLMQRAYAANAQVVQAGDQLMAIANGLRR